MAVRSPTVAIRELSGRAPRLSTLHGKTGRSSAAALSPPRTRDGRPAPPRWALQRGGRFVPGSHERASVSTARTPSARDAEISHAFGRRRLADGGRHVYTGEKVRSERDPLLASFAQAEHRRRSGSRRKRCRTGLAAGAALPWEGRPSPPERVLIGWAARRNRAATPGTGPPGGWRSGYRGADTCSGRRHGRRSRHRAEHQ